MKQIRVLLVDDSLQFLDSAADFLACDGRVLVVGRARDGQEGVRLAEELAPDLVLMDLSMSVMDGLAATRLIKARPAPPRVVIVTLRDSPEDRQGAHSARADGFICKSEFTDRVLAAVDALSPGLAPLLNRTPGERTM